MLQRDHYTYRVTWSGEDREYVGLCAEFPSLSWLDLGVIKTLAAPTPVVPGQRRVRVRP